MTTYELSQYLNEDIYHLALGIFGGMATGCFIFVMIVLFFWCKTEENMIWNDIKYIFRRAKNE